MNLLNLIFKTIQTHCTHVNCLRKVDTNVNSKFKIQNLKSKIQNSKFTHPPKSFRRNSVALEKTTHRIIVINC